MNPGKGSMAFTKGFFLQKTDKGVATADLKIAATLLSLGAKRGPRFLAEPHKLPAIILRGEGVDGETIRILETDNKKATERVRKGYIIEGISLPTEKPIVVFEILPDEEKGQTKGMLEEYVEKWHSGGQLQVDAKTFSEHYKDLSVLAHEVVISREEPKVKWGKR